MLESLYQSFLLVVFSEMGDKTQLLALVLAVKYKKPWTIIAGILTATVLNHALAAWVGSWASTLFTSEILKWILALLFFAFAVWILIPDKDEDLKEDSRFGPFWTTTIAFFLAEMGDKTQLATAALGARFNTELVAVTIGTTLGMLVADGLAVFLGKKLTQVFSMQWIRYVTAGLFFLFGILILWQM